MNIRNRMISEAAANVARVCIESGYDRAKVRGMVPNFEKQLNTMGHLPLINYYTSVKAKQGANK